MSLAEPSEKEFFSRKEAARYLMKIGCPIALRTLENMAAGKSANRGPPYTKFTWGSVRYRRSDLDQWAKANMRRVE